MDENFEQDEVIKEEVTMEEYQQPGQGGQPGQPGQPGSNGMAIASLILGILSILAYCVFYVGIVLAIVGLILGILARKENKADKLALAGVICSAVGLAFGVIVLILFIVGTVMIANDPSLQYNSANWEEALKHYLNK